MLAGDRSYRIGDQILKEASMILFKRVRDPRLNGVTLTGVKMTKDLRHAYIYYSLLGGDEQISLAQAGFESAKGFMRKEIGEGLRLKYVPDIKFIYDTSLEYGQKMEKLLEEVVPR